MWVLILIALYKPIIIDSYELKSQCDKALRYEQAQSKINPTLQASKFKFNCILKKDLVKLDKVLRDK